MLAWVWILSLTSNFTVFPLFLVSELVSRKVLPGTWRAQIFGLMLRQCIALDRISQLSHCHVTSGVIRLPAELALSRGRQPAPWAAADAASARVRGNIKVVEFKVVEPRDPFNARDFTVLSNHLHVLLRSGPDVGELKAPAKRLRRPGRGPIIDGFLFLAVGVVR